MKVEEIDIEVLSEEDFKNINFLWSIYEIWERIKYIYGKFVGIFKCYLNKIKINLI